MGKLSVLLHFWAIGFGIGVLISIFAPTLTSLIIDFLPQILRNEAFIGALLAGVASSTIVTLSILLWASLSRR